LDAKNLDAKNLDAKNLDESALEVAMYDDDRDALAAEYVLGTLSADERDQAEALLAIDPGFAEIVRVWERRLGELNVMVEAVEPPAEVWDKIKTEVIGPEIAGPEIADSEVVGLEVVDPEPRLMDEEEFSFPPIEETSPQTAPELATETPPEAAAAETPAAEPEETISPTASQSLEDLLGEPLPEMARDLDEPSEALASSLLPSEPEDAKKSDSRPDTAQKPDLAAEQDFEADLKAVVLQDLGRDAGRDLGRGPAPEPFTPLTPPKVERSADIIVLARRMRRWRRITVAMSAIAALLAVYVAVSQFAPGLIPVSRQAPATATAQVAPPPSRLVAVLQQDPTTPAFLVSVDPQSRTLTVRRVSAAPEPGRSYELWLISNKYPTPRSLGVVGSSEFTARTLPASFDADTIRTASYAISLEPAGGSTTGVPTGPILFRDK
jgi:anti-sigma-K factor RskA